MCVMPSTSRKSLNHLASRSVNRIERSAGTEQERATPCDVIAHHRKRQQFSPARPSELKLFLETRVDIGEHPSTRQVVPAEQLS